MFWVRPELLVKIPRESPTISKIKVNFHQDFVSSMHGNFLRGQTDWGLFYWPNHSGKLGCPNKKKKKKEGDPVTCTIKILQSQLMPKES